MSNSVFQTCLCFLWIYWGFERFIHLLSINKLFPSPLPSLHFGRLLPAWQYLLFYNHNFILIALTIFVFVMSPKVCDRPWHHRPFGSHTRLLFQGMFQSGTCYGRHHGGKSSHEHDGLGQVGSRCVFHAEKSLEFFVINSLVLCSLWC